MKNIHKVLGALNIKEKPEERVVYQIVDLQIIKYKGIQSGDIYPGDDIYEAIDKCIEGAFWLYENELSFQNDIRDIIKDNEADVVYYESYKKAFYVFNEFMRTHMHLYFGK